MLRLWATKEKEGNATLGYCDFARAFSAPLFSNALNKKGKGDCFLVVYGRFLNISIIATPTIAIAAMIAAMPGSRYVSAMDA